MKPICWDFPKDLLARSQQAMAPYGAMGHEGLALWFGVEDDGIARVTHLVIPHGPGLTTHPLRLDLSMRAMSRLTRLAGELDCYWLGQIHSHPQRMLELSEVDKKCGIHVQDYLSVVHPFYARQSVSLGECGVNVYDQGGYRRLAAKDINTRILQSDREVEVIEVEVAA